MAASDVISGPPRLGAQRSVLRVLERLADLGARPEDSHDERLRQGTLIFASALITVLATVWVITYSGYGYPVSAAIPAFYQLVTVVGLVVLARGRRFDLFRTTQFVAYLLLPGLLQVSLGGFVASSAMVLWSIFTPLAALALLGLRRSVVWLVVFFAELVVLGLLDARFARSPAVLPTRFVTTFFVLNVVGVTLCAYVMLGYFVEQRERAHRALQAERERSERLLLNVLPGPIAERLKRDSGAIAEHHDAVSVLFADLVGFTERSVVMAAEDVVDLLNVIFSAFDRVADAEGVEKIKTIGDAYMLAGGLPEARPDHLEAVTRAALAMRDEIGAIARRTGQDWLSVRIGIDSGPVVAGVIGRRKFIYDLWGDTVNTASRMESHGTPGEIQVTERVATALGPEFAIRPRGTIQVKGKGPMATFLVDAAASRAEPGRAASGRRP
ncbi:adenylate/guanylate cyclase domain-containing protein [Nocardioides mesophilus]|uniref:Adenylate/guanylate cyclase domain-containing protein n=1 Tax=Nocardioides mesophilus TaxID=433659 RepID=A0A7G9RCX6_9ACTN|nr:adenylate/guanylate cyclase domain-containing protein [Nocardioides mesophilus]QNN53451.1 adenylate/guanylate cyclase domain-containing protein [Nocardioides mesophilus]